jgi:hypothetical protein
LAAFTSGGCGARNDFERKFNRIQLDMTEAQVDEIVLGHSTESREELTAIEREVYGPPDGPCKNTPIFRKHYMEKAGAIVPNTRAYGLVN